MKKSLLLLLCTGLVACQSGRDVPSDRQAQVSTVNNAVCVKVAPQGDEKVRRVFIYEGNHTESGMMREFYPQLRVSSNDCLPAIAYPYQAGKTYTWKIDLQSPQRLEKGDYPSNRIFTARFIWQQESVTNVLKPRN